MTAKKSILSTSHKNLSQVNVIYLFSRLDYRHQTSDRLLRSQHVIAASNHYCIPTQYSTISFPTPDSTASFDTTLDTINGKSQRLKGNNNTSNKDTASNNREITPNYRSTERRQIIRSRNEQTATTAIVLATTIAKTTTAAFQSSCDETITLPITKHQLHYNHTNKHRQRSTRTIGNQRASPQRHNISASNATSFVPTKDQRASQQRKNERPIDATIVVPPTNQRASQQRHNISSSNEAKSVPATQPHSFQQRIKERPSNAKTSVPATQNAIERTCECSNNTNSRREREAQPQIAQSDNKASPSHKQPIHSDRSVPVTQPAINNTTWQRYFFPSTFRCTATISAAAMTFQSTTNF
jgi:hypothetical protein